MRDCKEWMRSSEGRAEHPKTVSGQALKYIMKREISGAHDAVVLNRRYSIMDANLDTMRQREELSGVSYLSLKNFLRREYEKRLEVMG